MTTTNDNPIHSATEKLNVAMSNPGLGVQLDPDEADALGASIDVSLSPQEIAEAGDDTDSDAGLDLPASPAAPKD